MKQTASLRRFLHDTGRVLAD